MRRLYIIAVTLISSLCITLWCVGCKSNNDVVVEQPTEVSTTTTTVAEVIEDSVVTTTTTTTTTTIYVPDDSRIKFKISDTMSKDALRRHMNNLFSYIEEKIADGDFNVWFGSLSKKYREYISDKKELEIISKKSDYFANKGIVLQTPEEFFRLVVIQAREGEQLRFFDYKYVDRTHVKVICVSDLGKFTYSFVYEDGMWKLDR